MVWSRGFAGGWQAGSGRGRTCARCCARPRTAGRSPAGRNPAPDESDALAAVQPGQADQFIRADPALPFSRAVTVVRASSRESATSCWVCPRAHPAPSPICSRKRYAQSFRRPGGRFAAAIANTSGWGRPRTAGGPQGEAAPSIRGADPVLAGTALRTNGPKRGATVFHRHALHVPRRSLRPALQAVDFCSVRRCGHGQLLHWLASIQLWPTRLRRSRMLCHSMSSNRSTQGSGRPDGRRHPKEIAGSVSMWCRDNPTFVVHALAVSQFFPTGWLVLRADWFLNLLGQHHAPQANGTTIGSPSWFSRARQLSAAHPVLAMTSAVPALWVITGMAV